MQNMLNNIVMSKELVDSLFSMDSEVVRACDNKAREMCVVLFPDIDLAREENVELVIRPMSAVIALNEMLLQNIFSASSINGIYTSSTIPDSMKVEMIRNYGTLNGIPTVSSDLESIYSEVRFAMRDNDLNRFSTLMSAMTDPANGIDRVFFADPSMVEMVRNKLPYLQINNLEIMDFSKTIHNSGTLIGTAYDRGDYQRYQDFKKAKAIELPGMLDIYFSTDIEFGSIDVTRNDGNLYVLPDGYYIYAISATKNFTAIEDDRRTKGIVESTPSIYVVDGENVEEILFARYASLDFKSIVDPDEMTILDVLYKGFFPVLVDFNVYTREDVSGDRIKDSISEYLSSVGGSMSSISHNDMTDFIRGKGDNVVVSATNQASLFPRMNISFESNITFPLSRADLSIPVELNSESMTERTMRVFVRSVNVITE